MNSLPYRHYRPPRAVPEKALRKPFLDEPTTARKHVVRAVVALALFAGGMTLGLALNRDMASEWKAVAVQCYEAGS